MKKILLSGALAISLVACDFNDFGVLESDPYAGGERFVPVEHGMIVLGEKLEDPYTVENMTKALMKLYPTKAGSGTLTETDLYVRFLPDGQDEYDALEALGVEMIDHPVDYEIVKEGDYYHDEEIPEGEITWQYAVVPAGFSFPSGIEYEVLDKCFLSEHQVVTRAGLEDIDWDSVERESFLLTGNGSLISEGTKASASPSGRITIMDPEYDPDPIGVSGVRVSCNVFVKFDHCYTDEEGYYRMGKSFSFRPRYRLVFKNVKGFAIGFNLILVPASFSTLGKFSPEGVSVTIDSNSDRMLYCRSVVNNACYDYYESCSRNGASICTPPSNLRLWLFRNLDASSAVMLQQGALIDGSLLEAFLGEFTSLLKMFLPDVTIGLKGQDTYQSIYGLAQHECAHASHYVQVGNGYWNPFIKFIITSFVTSGWTVYGTGTEENHGYCELGESWAYYIQTRLYRDRYPESAASFGTSYWFKPQILYYLDEHGIDRFSIFKALTSDVHDIDLFKKKLLSLYPESKNTIMQAFSRYNQ